MFLFDGPLNFALNLQLEFRNILEALTLAIFGSEPRGAKRFAAALTLTALIPKSSPHKLLWPTL